MALPAEFADLEPYLGWDLATEPERYARRLSSTMDEMEAFYDAAFGRMEAVLDFCGDIPLEELTDEQRSLIHLMQSVIMVSFPVEVWKQPRVPDSGAAYLDLIREPVV
jgi:hypothetical protein